MERQTELLVSADIEIMFKSGDVENFRVNGVGCTWKRDEMSRAACEYWAAFDYVSNTWQKDWDWFTIKGVWVTSKKERVIQNGL